MQPPQVQSIEQIVADQAGAYQPGIDLIGKKQALLPEKYKAAQMGLEGKKTLGFNQINNQMTARGMSFSGIGADEQAQYLASEYLPGMQQLAYQQNEEEMALTGALAEIEKERRLGAFSIRERQQSSLEDYLREERQTAWEKEKFNIEMAQRRAEQAASAAGDEGPTIEQYMANSFGQIGTTDPNWRKNFGTENSGLVAQVAANYGLSAKEAKDMVYKYRKDMYGF